MKNNWQLYFTDVIKGKHKGIKPFFLRGLLRISSWGYGLLVSCRNWAFDRRYFRRYSPPIPLVISIGNIVAGGTGKTPVTLKLAQEFDPAIAIAILSRGYKSKAEKLSSPTLLSKGEGVLHPPAYCGDEPYLIAKRLPKAIVIVGKNRYAAANMAAHHGAQVVLLDDGMQHRRLARDLEVVVVNAHDLFGQGYLLPRGFLRERISSLSRADLIVINHVTDQQHFIQMQKKLLPHSHAPLVGMRMEIAQIWNSKGNAVESLKGKRVGMFCGIANPEQFERTITGEGAHIVARHILPDHEVMSSQQLQHFVHECLSKNAEMLICTEKDYVKLSQEARDANQELTIVWLEMQLEIVAGEENWKNFIMKAKNDLAHRV